MVRLAIQLESNKEWELTKAERRDTEVKGAAHGRATLVALSVLPLSSSSSSSPGASVGDRHGSDKWDDKLELHPDR